MSGWYDPQASFTGPFATYTGPWDQNVDSSVGPMPEAGTSGTTYLQDGAQYPSVFDQPRQIPTMEEQYYVQNDVPYTGDQSESQFVLLFPGSSPQASRRTITRPELSM